MPKKAANQMPQKQNDKTLVIHVRGKQRKNRQKAVAFVFDLETK